MLNFHNSVQYQLTNRLNFIIYAFFKLFFCTLEIIGTHKCSHTNFDENKQQRGESKLYMDTRSYIRETRTTLPDEYLTLSTLNT